MLSATEILAIVSSKEELYHKARFFAANAHKTQKIPGTKLPYILHPESVVSELRIAASVDPRLREDLMVVVGYLHDVLEDTNETEETLRLEFGNDVTVGVKATTKNKALPEEEQMRDSITRIKELDPEIWCVKLADRCVNLGEPPAFWSIEKIAAYVKEAALILQELGPANDYLRERLRWKITIYTQMYVKPGETLARGSR